VSSWEHRWIPQTACPLTGPAPLPAHARRPRRPRRRAQRDQQPGGR
jgi:hypothetical protein